MKINKKIEYLIIIITIIIGIALIIGGTVAYFNWTTTKEQNSTVSITIEGGGSGKCTKKIDNEKELMPSADKTGGRIITIDVSEEMAPNAVINWDLDITNIAEELKDASFKYELVNTTTGKSYGTGNFSSAEKGNTISFSNDTEKLSLNTNYIFTLYLWIDGNMTNPSTMQNKDYNFDLACNITGTD